MKPKDVNVGAPNDYKAEEEFQEETFERVNGNHYKLIKVKKTEEQKKKEQEEAQEKLRQEEAEKQAKEDKEKAEKAAVEKQ